MRPLILFLAAGLASLATAWPHAMASLPAEHSMYVSVTDGKGQPVPNVSVDDLRLREGGKDRAILRIAAPTDPMRIAVLVEESLTMDTYVRLGLRQFVEQMWAQAEIGIYTVGFRNVPSVEYTHSLERLNAAIAGFSLNPNASGEHMPEGIFEAALSFTKSKPARPVIVAIARETQQSSSEDPHRILEELQKSRTTLEVVTIPLGVTATDSSLDRAGHFSDLAARGQVFGDGSQQSGGRRVEVPISKGVPRAMQQIADDLRSQVLVTYSLNDGEKHSGRVTLTSKRKDVSVRAPTRVPKD